MTISLGLNISSLKSQRQLARSSDELSNVFTRLSSGQRINRASDDAAGLAIADSLSADSRVFNQGVRNLNDGISVLNIADGALQELTNITFRLTELAEQAANGTLGSGQRASLDEEAQALKAEYFRIAKTTEFNGRKLFEGNYGVLSLQAGYGVSGRLGDGLGGAIGDGTLSGELSSGTASNPRAPVSGDLDGDGNMDVVAVTSGGSTLNILLGNGNGTFQSSVTLTAAAGVLSVALGDLNGDGILDIAATRENADQVLSYIGNGDGTFQSAITSSVGSAPQNTVLADFNGDGKLDVVNSSYTDGGFSLSFGNGDGTFTLFDTIAVTSDPPSILAGDYNGDGVYDIAMTDYLANRLFVLLGNGDGSFQSAVSYVTGTGITGTTQNDFNNDGHLDIALGSTLDGEIGIYLNNGDGTFQSAITVTSPSNDDLESGDLNGDGNADIISQGGRYVLLGNGDGTFQGAQTFVATGAQMDIADFNNDGVLDVINVVFGTNTINTLLGNTVDGVSPLLEFSLRSTADARQALSQFQHKIAQLSEQRGQIGAFQSRIEVAEKVLKVSSENFKAAESRIRDADIAQESANLVRLQILQQAASSVLGQANQQPQLVLQLLRGNA